MRTERDTRSTPRGARFGLPSFEIVIPTIGRPSLATLLEALDACAGPLPARVVVVDDRRDGSAPLDLGAISPRLADRIEVIRSGGRGPAAARNAGWAAAGASWVVFLDDDVRPDEDWLMRLARDLAAQPPDVGGCQGRLRVPLPEDRAPTDWERNVRLLETAAWTTADMAYRRRVLAEVGGFDERFPRAYREDSDLGLRVTRAGYRIVRGRRKASHPVRPARWSVSVRVQAGNADDVLMHALHGRWQREPRRFGRRRNHFLVTGCAVLCAVAAVAGAGVAAAAAALGWFVGTAEFAWARIAPGPRDAREIARMSVTSLLIPPVACAWTLVGYARLPRLLADRARAPAPRALRERLDARVEPATEMAP